MAKQTVYLALDLTISEGQLDAFESIAQAMVEGSQKEPGTLGYEWFLSADRKRCRLLETYKDANAVLAHFNGPVVQELVPKLLGTSNIADFEVYGDPGPKGKRDGRRIRGRDLRVPARIGSLTRIRAEPASFADRPFMGLLASD